MARGGKHDHHTLRPGPGLCRRPIAHRWLAALTAAILVIATAGPGARAETRVLVFAAASLTEVMTAIATAYGRKTGIRVSLSFAASSALARQIENGAPATVFVSANQLWMDRLEATGHIAPDTRSDIAGNRLALIAPRGSSVVASIEPSLDLRGLLGDGRLAMGDPDHVPAGLYGRAALQTLGQWRAVEPRLARTSDVRGALALVGRGEAPLGITYATDAEITDTVRIVALFPDGSHPPIVYPAALTTTADDDARDFFRFLTGSEAEEIISGSGFAVPTGERP